MVTDDNEIIRRIIEGNKNEYRILVERYQQMVFRTCMGFVHNSADAEDITQDVFIKAYLSLKTFRMESSFSTWLYRIAVNASLNREREKKKNFIVRYLSDLMSTGSDTIPVSEIYESQDPESILIGEEHRARVKKALDSLPDNQRTAIILSKYEDLSQKEIADIMGKSEGAVEALLQRAKANLRTRLTAGSKKNNK